MEFKEYHNSFLDAAFMTDVRVEMKKPDQAYMNSLSTISALYQYSNPPPMGYGTPAPKVAETVLRAYSMNKKPEEQRTITIDGYPIEDPVWEGDSKFPWEEPASNFCPAHVHESAIIFLKNNKQHIIETVENVVTRSLNINADVLTKGKQTYCPLNESSLPCAKAYKNMMNFFIKNGAPSNMTLYQLIAEYMKILSKKEVWGTKVSYEKTTRNRMVSGTLTPVHKKKKVITWVKYKEEEAFHYTLGIGRSFCTYIKHSERGHLKRRAIASPNIVKRAFLKIIEDVHLELGKLIDGSTISIGGEEKKVKIIDTINSIATDEERLITKQGTEDATKWNETLSAALFCMIQKTFFDEQVRKNMGIRPCSDLEKLYARTCEISHFLLAIKRVTLGEGLQGKTENFHGSIPYDRKGLEMVNNFNKDWFEKILKLREGNNYIMASPGMLMGMHNALSTTVGLVPVNHLHKDNFKMRTLRSSDDSMTIHAGSDMNDLLMNMNLQYYELKLTGIALSLDKTIVCNKNYGEFTSWFQDGKLVSQYGPETTTLRPGGKNPHDDFFSAAKSSSVSLLNCTSNPFGTEVKLTLSINNIRSLYRIKVKTEIENGVRPKIRVLADGGLNMWDIGNCHLEETSLKKFFCNEVEKGYFLKIRNPENPFASEVEEQVYFDKDSGCLTSDFLENPRTVFSYQKRSNRAAMNKKGPTNAEEERAAQEALDIITMLDLSTTLMTPDEATPSGLYSNTGLQLLRADLDLSESEKFLFERASKILRGEKVDDLRGEATDYYTFQEGNEDSD
nr:MAG: PB1 [Byreska virus]